MGVFTPERRVGVQDVEGDGDQCAFGNEEVHVAGGEWGGKGNGQSFCCLNQEKK